MFSSFLLSFGIIYIFHISQFLQFVFFVNHENHQICLLEIHKCFISSFLFILSHKYISHESDFHFICYFKMESCPECIALIFHHNLFLYFQSFTFVLRILCCQLLLIVHFLLSIFSNVYLLSTN